MVEEFPAERGEGGWPTEGAGARYLADGGPPRRSNSWRWIAMVLAVVVTLAVGLGLLLRSGSGHDKKQAQDGSTTELTSPVVTSGSSAPRLCGPGSWSVVYDDAPNALLTPAGPGAYVWRDDTGWHVRVRDPDSETEFKVVLTGASSLLPETFSVVSPDGGTLNVAGKTATFDGRGTPDLNGFDFGACFIREMRVQVLANGAPLPPTSISIGLGNTAPENPLVITRRA